MGLSESHFRRAFFQAYGTTVGPKHRVKDVERYRQSARSALERVMRYGEQLARMNADAVQSLQIVRLRDMLERKFAPATVWVTLAFYFDDVLVGDARGACAVESVPGC